MSAARASAARDDDAPLAAVDLGSNSFHLVVGKPDGHALRILDKLKERVALAEGLDERRELDEASQERALACLARFGDRIRGLPGERVRAAGTNTLRAARNAEGFLRRAREALGHPVEVISGAEEARLIYQGVAHTEQPRRDRRLVVDIGGGSTECVVGRGFEVLRADSLRMGCVTFSRGFFPDGRIDADRLRAARFAAGLELEPLIGPFADLGHEEVLGSSGTNREVGEILRASGYTGGEITREALLELEADVLKADSFDDLDLPGLSESRRPVLVGGLAILRATFDALGLERMRPTDGALREGLLYELLGRTRGRDLREDTVARLQERFSVGLAQANRVAETLEAFIDDVTDDWELDDPRLRRAGRWAAQLHEIGLAIRHSGYHKHGAYLLENTDLPGFTRGEQRLVAALVLAHRRRFRTEPLEAVGGGLGKRAVRLAALLRIAVRVHRARGATQVPRPTLSARKKRLVATFPPGTLDAHPMLRLDLEAEQERAEKADLELDVEEAEAGGAI